ncbi:hypothetical protein [Blastopirellula marina]|uniref:Uncharacterized protein n=1 Tax=Blastopirellula marina TaxID=124 RepID=A0A2S8GRF8_9BACT|nr:hypothetical protein [Blastopirellula marina]PQO47010.1 hypothetical protein C5Y93_05815 [Blastopirellula marina]
MAYEFPPDIAAKIASFRQSAEATSLLDEISILKMLLQEETTKKNPRVCIELATAIGRLSKLIDLQAERDQMLIHRNKLTQLVESLVDVLINEFQGSMPGWEDKIENVANKFGTLLIVDHPEQEPG